MDYRDEAPADIRSFLTYMETIVGKSTKTCNEYYLDLRTFFRYILRARNLVDKDIAFDAIKIDAVDLNLIASVSIEEVYSFMLFASRDLPKHHKSSDTTFGNAANARARKTSTLRSFYKYLTVKAHKIENNPVVSLDLPKTKQSLPRNLSLDESVKLLSSIDGAYKERDFCIITLCLNCGLRVSEVAGINLHDYNHETLRVLGKGNKERVVYLNDACRDALNAYIAVRITPLPADANALFVSRQRNRIGVQTIKAIVYAQLKRAGLGDRHFSVHKLRHTAATLMYQNGVDVRTLKEVLGHSRLDTTMIYTHITDDNLKYAADQSPLAHIKPTEKPEKTDETGE